MKINITQSLADMFEAGLGDPDYYTRFPPYRGDVELGAKPWWPPLSQVWQCQGLRPDWDANQHWAPAWALLSELHGQYSQAKKGGQQ